MQIKEHLRNKAFKKLGLLRYEGPAESDKLTFVNDTYRAMMTKLQEYNVWYDGDDEELLNFYTKGTLINFNYEPIYSRNKHTYFWATASTEGDVKLTHSGQPKNIADTIVNIVGEPTSIKVEGEATQALLDKIVEENDYLSLFKEEQLPYTLVEGWGAYKINWDMDFSETPLIEYYPADRVDFLYKSRRLVGIIYKDFYVDIKGKKYLITETRSLGKDEDTKRTSLFVEKELFEVVGDETFLTPRNFEDVEELKHVKQKVEIEGYNKLLGEPCILYKSKNPNMYGRSIFAGKIALFDDLDQVWSQMANTTRKSTPIEYFDVNFLEKDKKTGAPKQPKAYDRKYTMYAGAKGADGTVQKDPVHVTQPELRFEQYIAEAKEILVNIVSGLLSPATMGIEIAKKDNADAQREKEKTTVFTRNAIIDKQTRIIKSLLVQCMNAYELMHTGTVTIMNYDITVKFSEFADDSFDNKLSVLGQAHDKKIISPKMLVSKLYNDEELSDEDRQAEIDYITENNKEPFEDGFNPDGTPTVPGGNPFGGGLDEDENPEDL